MIGIINKAARSGLLALVILAGPLAGCTTAGGLIGSADAELSDPPYMGDYTAERALAEARQHFRNNDFGHSASFYKRFVELAPQSAEGYVGLGASYDRLHRFDLSDRVYDKLFRLSGGTAQYYNNMGFSQMLRGNLTAALSNFRKASALDPRNPVIANNLKILSHAAAAA
jgi:Flp pilus assembly protein TadD